MSAPRPPESHADKLARVLADPIHVVPYDPGWPDAFEREAAHLRACLPPDLVGRIEHFGSTAVPGLASKPIVDMLVEVHDLDEAQRRIAPVLEAQGYEYFWRPSFGDDTPPFYAWFIKRDADGRRTHHIHMIEPDFAMWEQLRFRDYLRAHPDVAEQYGALKMKLAAEHVGDRSGYTLAKGEFIGRVMEAARRESADE